MEVRGRGTFADVHDGCASAGDGRDMNKSGVFVRRIEKERKKGGVANDWLKTGVAAVREMKKEGAFRCQVEDFGEGGACYCLRRSGLAHAAADDDDSNSLCHKDLSS